MNPNWAMIGNLGAGLLGLLESTGLTNVLTNSGNKAAAYAATAVLFINAGLHAISTAKAGILSSSVVPTK